MLRNQCSNNFNYFRWNLYYCCRSREQTKTKLKIRPRRFRSSTFNYFTDVVKQVIKKREGIYVQNFSRWSFTNKNNSIHSKYRVIPAKKNPIDLMEKPKHRFHNLTKQFVHNVKRRDRKFHRIKSLKNLSETFHQTKKEYANKSQS